VLFLLYGYIASVLIDFVKYRQIQALSMNLRNLTSIDQYQWLFDQDQVKLTFTPDALNAIVDRAIESGTGARALHTEIERALMPHMFHLRQYRTRGIDTLVIDTDKINNPEAI
jgi:ATP-dependent protease Clp ATPase subunit